MRPIDADAMLEYLNLMYDNQNDSDEPYNCAVLGAINYIKHKAPTIDAVSVVHGEWIGYNADKEDWLRKDGTPIFLICNKCHGTVINNGSAHWNYCPNCGAKMDGERKNDGDNH